VEAVDIAQDHQQVGLEQDRRQRREIVVVAELDLLDETVSFSLTTGDYRIRARS